MRKLLIACMGLWLAGCSPQATGPNRDNASTTAKGTPHHGEPTADTRVADLIRQLQHGNPAERVAAAQELRDIGAGAKEAVPALTDALSDAQRDVRVAAGEALTKVDAAVPLGGLVVELTKALEGNEEEAKKAAECLGRLGPAAQAAAPALAKALTSGAPALREQAVRALGDMGPSAREAVPELIAALQDKETDEKLRAAAGPFTLRGFFTYRGDVALALGKIGADARPAAAALLAVIEETRLKPNGVNKADDVTLHEAAVEALKKIDPAAAAGIP